MAKQKDRPQKANGGAGGGWQGQPQSHSASEPFTGVPPGTPQTVVGSPVGGPGLRTDVPTMRPPGFSTAPGAFVRPGGKSWQAPGFPPPPAGEIAESAFSLQAPLPIGEKATHFSGPIVSGGIPQVSEWITPHGGPMLTNPIGGSAMLTAGLWLDYSQGNFTIPIQFPDDSLIVAFGDAAAVDFTSAPTWQLGTTPGASDIGSGGIGAVGDPLAFTPAVGQLPLWGMPAPFLAYLTVAANTGTAGLGVILVQFIRIAQRWT